MSPNPRLLFPELGGAEQAEGWIDAVPEAKVTAADVCAALDRRHDPGPSIGGLPGRWVFLREVQAATGRYGDVQRFDAVAVGLVPSVKYARVVYEVKVARSDWLHELEPLVEVRYNGHQMSRRTLRAYLREGEEGKSREALLAELSGMGYTAEVRSKWQRALDVSTEFYFAAPPRVIQLHEVPEEAGLVEVRPWGPRRELRARVIRPAPVRDTPHPGPEWWAAVLRRAARRAP